MEEEANVKNVEEKIDEGPSSEIDAEEVMEEVEEEKEAHKEGHKEEKHMTEKKKKENNDEDELLAASDEEELLKFVEESEPKIYVVGAGGSGCNTLNRLFELGIKGAKLIAMNTDARHLLQVKANRKVVLGKSLTRGRGAGSNPEIGQKAAEESVEQIKEVLKDANLVFVTCGLGGGTGTGSAPIIAKIAKNDIDALTVAVVTLPFTSEGRIRMENAIKGLEKLRKYVDTVIVIRNDKLLTIAPDLPLNTAFKVCDEVLAGSVKGITELVTKAGMVNVDFADLTTILKNAGTAVIGLGEASAEVKHEERAKIAIETALNSPLLDADVSTATRALININGGSDMTLKEANYIVEETARRIYSDAHIIQGSRIEEDMKKSAIRVLVVLAGVTIPKYSVEGTFDIENLDLELIG